MIDIIRKLGWEERRYVGEKAWYRFYAFISNDFIRYGDRLCESEGRIQF